MPLCPQITNTPITVSLTADFTVTDVIPVLPATTTQVNQALVDAQAALDEADAALAQANIAYNAAIASLQPSANTIVNASNQITAINGNGITVYAGSSPSSGARVVLNSAGLAGYNSGGTATFAIESSTGNVSMAGALLSGGSITGTSINVPSAGSPAFSVNALGAVTASNITINGGQIFMNGGVFSVSSLGALTATNANITGTITATSGSFSGTLTSSSGTIAGWTLSSTSFTNAGADTFLVANPGSDGVAYSTIGRGIMRRLQLNGSSGTTLGTNVLAVGGNAAVDGSLAVVSNTTVSGYIYNPGYQVSTSGGAARINDASTPTARLVAASGSSIRFKNWCSIRW